VRQTEQADALSACDYVLDYDQRNNRRVIPDDVWSAALSGVQQNSQRLSIGLAAYQLQRSDGAIEANMPLAAAGDSGAMDNLGGVGPLDHS
jgi:hypothetical protein